MSAERARRARDAMRLSRRWRFGPIEHRATLRGHHEWVISLARVGSLLISGSDDGSIRCWDAATGGRAAVLPDAHRMPVTSLAARSFLYQCFGHGSCYLEADWAVHIGEGVMDNGQATERLDWATATTAWNQIRRSAWLGV